MRIFWMMALMAFSASAQTMQPWVVRGGDNAHSGWNPNETTLTQASVRARGLNRAVVIPVAGDARGVEAQPLILPGVKMASGFVQDVMILPSMANVVRGVDAHTGVGYWQVTLGTPITGSAQIDMHRINQFWGCLSTGVIDPDTQRLYQVCWVSQDGSGTPQSGRYEMFVLNVKDGTLVVPPAPVQGSDTSMWKQRSSLVMTNVGGRKTVFFAHGSVYETSTGYTGGITEFDVATNTVAVTLPMTAGIWMGGAAMSADPNGYLYAITGNGDFDPAKGFYGESLIKVKYTPASGGAPPHAATLAVVDQWSPWTDYARAGKPLPADKLAGDSLPSETSKPVGGNMAMSMKGATLKAVMNDQGQPTVLVYPMASGAWSDEDWGSAGPACVFAVGVCVATGKDGIGYPISATALGSTTAATVGTAANYAKLAFPCVWLTASPGPVNCAPEDPRTLNFFPNGYTIHEHGQPVQFYDPLLKSWAIALGGENSQVHKWAVTAKNLTYQGEGNEYASSDLRGRPPGGMAGSMCSGSSNGQDPNSYLLVCLMPYGDSNATVTPGHIVVYDPIHIVNGVMPTLWDSGNWGARDPNSQWYCMMDKFLPPVIDGGEVIVPCYDGRVFLLK